MQIRFGEHSELVTPENPLPVYIVGGSGGELEDGSITTEKFAEDAKAPLSGVADSANSVDWEDVGSKPATFTPSTHTHNASDINAGVLNVARIPSITTAMLAANAKAPLAGTADSASAVAWTGVTGKPTTFTSSAHNHSISEVTGLQSAIDAKLTATIGAAQADSIATTFEELLVDHNSLLAILRSVGVIAE